MAATANFLTCTITKLELFSGETRLANATGFFLKREDQNWLVSNWHVFSGRNPETGQPINPMAATPDRCRFFVADFRGDNLNWTPHDVDLGASITGTASWYQHPTEGQSIDIGVIPIIDINLGKAKDFLDPTGHDEQMFIDLGGELFLPGYPLGLTGAGLLPIWKRASLASSLEFGEGQDRFFYVDTATREGMSGAPCLAISNWRHYSLDRSTGKMRVVDKPMSWRLLGVYSGRRNPSDSFEAQIGVVWREGRLFEIIAAKSPATVNLR